MRRRIPLAVLALAAGLTFSVSATARAAPDGAQSVTSTTWAGYAATGASGAFTSVTATWRQPTANCGSAGSGRYAAFWVGLDGYSSSSVEQVGTEFDCSGGTATYYGWYEVYPSPAHVLAGTISPGDTVKATLTYKAPSTFQFTLANLTRGTSQTASLTSAGAPRSSAEVITEMSTPVSSGNPFSSVSYTGALVNGSGLCNSHPVQIVMPSVSVSPISNCEVFSVTPY